MSLVLCAGPEDVRERSSSARDGRELSALVLNRLALRAAKGSASCLATSSRREVCSST